VPAMKPLTPTKWAAILVLIGALVWYTFQVMQPPLPVTVQFRSATSRSGFILIFKNESDHALSFTATLAHQGQRAQRKFPIQVPAHSASELGSSQGWLGQSGDRISLTSAHYKVWTGAIP
jgi:hypothetical protein